ncbi:MAG: TRAP transporter small permease [Alphaproteobacteria bacterium]
MKWVVLGLTAFYRWVGYGAVLCLIAAMLVTVADVLLRRSVNLPIFGVVDMVQLAVVAAAYLSIPYAFMVDGHVSIGILADSLPTRFQLALRVLAALLTSLVVGGIGYYSAQRAIGQIETGDISQNLGIPMIFYWAPLVAGCALSVVGGVVITVAAATQAITGGPFPLPSARDEGR